MKKLQLILAWVLGIGVIAGIIGFGVRDSMKTEINKMVDAPQMEHPDADQYYSSNGQLVNSYKTYQSQTVQTEKEINQDIEDRGFGESPINYRYSMNGDYLDETMVGKNNEKHPIYETEYISTNNEAWIITVINGQVMANPVTYNMEYGASVQVLISESDVITSYDSETNKFYETIPDPSVLNVKVVNKIDAQTLDQLTVEVIKGL